MENDELYYKKNSTSFYRNSIFFNLQNLCVFLLQSWRFFFCDEMLLQCQNSNCGVQFEEKYISHGAPEIPVTKPEDRFIAIFDSLQKTRIFCLDCVLLYAQMVCTHGKIELDWERSCCIFATHETTERPKKRKRCWKELNNKKKKKENIFINDEVSL